ncbi:MAG: Asp23/Gls24 family envelope stress response protein [Oscillospiraceae bacterium]|nr:Asp23/Gls24 family envelope stress response protein [Oscillospiraceae bacterium]
MKLDNEKGAICISTDVITWLAGDAATRCFGVKGMAGRAKESGLVQLLRRESMTKGVSVTPNEDGSITVELHIVVDHGVNLSALSQSIMNEVSYKITSATDVPVRRVDVFIDSMILD